MPQELTVSLPQKVACHEKPHSLYSYIVNVSYSMVVQIICDISGGGGGGYFRHKLIEN